MRTRDFSAAPALARAEAMLTLMPHGGDYRVAASPRWLLQVRGQLRSAPGLVRREWLRPGPRPTGVVAFFDEPAQAQSLLAALEQAGVGVTAQLHVAHPTGYSNGSWRVESSEMTHIEHFSRLPGEGQPPRVAEGPRDAAAGAG